MAGFDPDVFGSGGSTGFDPEVFASRPKMVDRKAIAAQINSDPISQGARDFASEGWGSKYMSAVGGLVRGAGSIGATLARPFESKQENDQRRKSMDEALSGFGADPNSLVYKGGKLTSEVAGTLGVGGALAAPVRALGAVAPAAAPTMNALATGLQTGGFSVPGLSGAAGMGARMLTGGLSGGAAAGLVDPEYAGTGAAFGALLPPGVQVAGKAGQFVSDKMRAGANRLMQSAIKPTLQQLKSGDAATATQVLLEKGLNPTRSGVEKLGGMIDDVDNQITSAVSGSTAQIDKQKVLQALNDTRQKFGTQAVPQADLAAIQTVEDAFRAHPGFPGQSIPVQDAQALKRGTYQVLAKKYGQMGSADTEAQKALARGLKEEIAAAVPGIDKLNAEQARLLIAKKVAERRALMESNKNPLGLAALAPNTTGVMAFMADKSALLKSLGARGMYSAAPMGNGLGLLGSPALLPYLRGGLLATEANP